MEKWFTVAEYCKTYENGILPPTAALDVDTLPTFNDIDNFPGLSPAPQSDVDSENDTFCLQIQVGLQDVQRKDISVIQLRMKGRRFCAVPVVQVKDTTGERARNL